MLSNDTDIAQSYQENYFTVVKTEELDTNKIYFISKFDTEYAKFKGNTYFVAHNDKIMAYKAKGEIDNGRLTT